METSVNRSLTDRDLILVAGKGGVGRSTVAGSLALALSTQGKRVLIYQAQAKDRLGPWFTRPPAGEQVTSLAPGIDVINTTPKAALHEYGKMILRFERVVKMLLENRLTKHFLAAVPGLSDYSLLGKLWHMSCHPKYQGRWDTIIFDMPASGHSLTLLKIPFVIRQTVSEGPLASDARKIIQWLQGPKTATVLVTLPEEMPLREAKELQENYSQQLSLPISQVFVNKVYPVRLYNDYSLPPEVDSLWQRHRNVTKRQGKYLEEIENAFPAITQHLPMLFTSDFSQSQLEQLANSFSLSKATN